METFLVRELGYSWDEVHDEAEVLEHAVSDRMLDRIDAKLGHPTRDPHGDPIPAADGQVPTPDARQLSVCQDGDAGTVARISDADPEMLRYFDSVGHQPGFAAAGAGPPRLRRDDLGGSRGPPRALKIGHHRRPGKPCRRSDLGCRLTKTTGYVWEVTRGPRTGGRQSGNCSLARWRRHDVAGVSVWPGRWPANAWPAYETAGDPSLMRPRARDAMAASTARITETPKTTVSP